MKEQEEEEQQEQGYRKGKAWANNIREILTFWGFFFG